MLFDDLSISDDLMTGFGLSLLIDNTLLSDTGSDGEKLLANKSCIELQEKYHTNCLFKNILRRDRGFSFNFDNKGRLKGSFFCHKKYQDYDNRIHGGIMATIIDEPMVHCLMGHGVVGLQ